ncbi:hypothetical protein [Prevotella pallens]|uniref:hypothetical protein n=1 Tax=Prevotella pallens TaxID=60133 RepID=UPI0028ED5B1D|nr:hypothetical protein [Prevotella pallens]
MKKQKWFNFFVVVSLIFSFCFFQHRIRIINERIEYIESSISDIESKLDDAEASIKINRKNILENEDEINSLELDLDDITNN